MQTLSLAKIDLYLFNLINGFAKKSRMLDFFGIFCAAYLGFGLLAWLCMAAYVNQNWRLAVIPMFAGLISLALNEAIYLFYKRKRPMEVISDTVLIGKPFSPAFPSSHTSFFFALSFTLFLFNFQLAITFIILTFFISFFRIFCGVHWPSDIIGGIFSALISFLIINTVSGFI